MISALGKLLIFFGGFLILIGSIFLLSQKITWIGKLPGDIHIQKGNFAFYFPITTCLLLSLIISLLFWLVTRK